MILDIPVTAQQAKALDTELQRVNAELAALGGDPLQDVETLVEGRVSLMLDGFIADVRGAAVRRITDAAMVATDATLLRVATDLQIVIPEIKP